MATMLRAVGLLGVVVFGALLYVLLAYPKELEHSAVGFIKERIEAELLQTFPDLGDDPVAEGGERLATGMALWQTHVREALRDGLPELVAEVIAGHCGCAARRAVVSVVVGQMRRTIEGLEVARARLGEVIRGRYDAIFAALRQDLTIFLGSNAAAFALVFAVATVRAESSRLTLLPAALLVVAAVASSALYLLDQDWFYTVLFQDYAGYGYTAGMALIFGLRLDIAMNQGRITRTLARAVVVPGC